MRLPNFLIIGAQKCGTSWFARIISQHPDIFVFAHEIHFFDKIHNYSRGLEWYKEHFADATNYAHVGEKTPDYLWANGLGSEGHLPEVHKNIHHHLPTVRLITVLRNPVERAISAINHLIKTGRVSPLISIERMLKGDKFHLLERHGVISKGMYYKQIEAFMEYFSDEQMLILIYEEDLIENPQEGLRKICYFLGADSSFRFSNLTRKINVHKHSKARLIVNHYVPAMRRYSKILDKFLSTKKLKPTMATYRYLYDLYSEPNEMLYSFLGRKIPSWKPQDIK
jgi:hypothetical protein